MDEPTQELAQIPAPKPKPPKKDGPSMSGQRGVFLLFGVMIGAAVVLLTLHYAQNPEVVYKQPDGPPKQTTPIQDQPNKTIQPPTDAKGPEPPKSNLDPTKPTTGGTTPSTGAKPTAGNKPFNPFDGSMPPKEISGSIKGGPGVDPVGTGVQTVPDEATPPKAVLITVRLDVGDPTAAIKALQALAAKEGGSAIQYDETAMRGEAEGAIMFVPADKLDDAQKQLSRVGTLVATDKWSGNQTDRIDRVERIADDRISDLHMRRQELLVKYFEDAPQVKHVDEDTDRITKCLAAFRAQKPGPGTAVIKIRFLG